MSNSMLPWFYLLLYLIGLLSVLPLVKKIPIWVLAFSGFLWGKLVLVFCSMIILIFGIPYDFFSISSLLAAMVVLFVILNIRRNTFKLLPNQYFILAICAISIFLAGYFLTESYYIFATTDSFSIIIHSKVLAQYGLQPYTLDQFTKWGIITSVFQMASTLVDLDFLSGYQTILAGSLLLLLTTGIYIELRKAFDSTIGSILTGVTILGFLSLLFIEHSVYIQTNLTAATYIFFSLFAIWKYLKESNQAWLILGSIALIGVGFSRIEGPMYLVLFGALAVSMKELPTSHSLGLILPSATLSLAWNTYLYFKIEGSGVLDQTNLMITIVALIGLIGYALISARIKKKTFLQYLVLGTLSAGLVVTFIIKPAHIAKSIYHMLYNLSNLNSWGLTWIIILLLFPLVIDLDSSATESRFLLFNIIGFILLVVMFSFTRDPYRLGTTDSANRLLLTIQPVIYFYIASNINGLRQYLHIE